jgi:predicted nucleic acid-binding protein
MIVVDSNVLIDIFNRDPQWSDWSRAQVQRLNDDGHELIVNHVIVAEIATNFSSVGEMREMLDELDIEILPLNDDVAFAAGRAFRDYRRAHRERDAILADFLIGGQATTLSAPILTRDLSLYRRYFSDLTLITPETHHG